MWLVFYTKKSFFCIIKIRKKGFIKSFGIGIPARCYVTETLVFTTTMVLVFGLMFLI